MSIYRSALIRLNIIRLISAVVIAAFAVQDLAWAGAELRSGAAVPSSYAVPAARALTLEALIADPSLLPVPAGRMLFRERSAGSNGRLILHVQDAHANYAAQKNIASSLAYWMDKFPRIRLVAVEGGSGDGSLDRFRESAPAGLWKRAAAQLLRDGSVTGEEYLNLTSDRPMRIWGVEDQELYDRNRAVYARVAAVRPGLQPALRRMRTAVETLKARTYPQPILDYEAALKSAGSAAFWDHAVRSEALGYLPAAARPETGAYPVWDAWEALRAEEALSDGARLQKEMDLLIAGLPADHPAVARLQTISPADPESVLSVWTEIADAARESSRGQVMPGAELGRYLARLERVRELDVDALAEAADRIEQAAYAAVLKDPDAARLREADRYLTLLENAVTLKLDGGQVGALKAGMKRFPPRHWTAWLNRRLADLGLEQHWVAYDRGTDRALREIRTFYELAARRDEAFVRNLDAALTRSGDSAAFLIAGGYHSSNVIRLLKEKGYTFAVCAPVTDEETDWEVYEKNLLAPDALGKITSAPATRPADLIRQPFAAKALAARMADASNRPVVSEVAKYVSAAKPQPLGPAPLNDPRTPAVDGSQRSPQAARLARQVRRALRALRVSLARMIFWREIGRWTEFSALVRAFGPAEGHVVSVADAGSKPGQSGRTAGPFAARVTPLFGGEFQRERIVDIEEGGLRHPIFYGIGWKSGEVEDPVVSYQGSLDPATPARRVVRIRSLLEVVRRLGASETITIDRSSLSGRDQGAIGVFAGMSRASWPSRSVITAQPTPFHGLIGDRSAGSAGSRYWIMEGTDAAEIARRTDDSVELLEFFGLPYHLIFSSDTRGGSLPSPSQRHLLRAAVAVPAPASGITAAQAAGYFLYPDQQGFRSDFPRGTDAGDQASSILSQGLVPAQTLLQRLGVWRESLSGFRSRLTDLEAAFIRGGRPRYSDFERLKRELHHAVRSMNRPRQRNLPGASGYRAHLLALIREQRLFETALRAPRRHHPARVMSQSFWNAIFEGVRILGTGPQADPERPVRIKVAVMTRGDRSGAAWEALTDTENIAADHSVVSHRDLAALRHQQLPSGSVGDYLGLSVYYVPSVRLEGEEVSRPLFLMDLVPGVMSADDPYYTEPSLAVRDLNRLLEMVHRSIPESIRSDTWVDMSRMRDRTFRGVVDALEQGPGTVQRTVTFPWTGLEDGKPAENEVFQFSSVAGALEPGAVAPRSRLNAARMSRRSDDLEKNFARAAAASQKLHAIEDLIRNLDSLERHAGKGLEAGSHGYVLGRARIRHFREMTSELADDPDIALVDTVLAEAGLARDGSLLADDGILPDMKNYEEYERQVTVGRELRDAVRDIPLRREWIDALNGLSAALVPRGASAQSRDAESLSVIRGQGQDMIALLGKMLPIKAVSVRKALERNAPVRELDTALEELEALRQAFAALWDALVIDWLRSPADEPELLEPISVELIDAVSEWRRIDKAFLDLAGEENGGSAQMEFRGEGFQAKRSRRPAASSDTPFGDVFKDEAAFRRILRDRFDIEHEHWNKYSAAFLSWKRMRAFDGDQSIQALTMEFEAHHAMLTAADGSVEVFWDIAARALSVLGRARTMRARLRSALRREGNGAIRARDLRADAAGWDPALAEAEPGLAPVLAALQLSYARRNMMERSGPGQASFRDKVPVSGLGPSSDTTREHNRVDLDRAVIEAWLDDHRIGWMTGLGRLIRAKARWTHLAARARARSKDRAASDAQLIKDADDFVKKNLGLNDGVYSPLAQEIHIKLALGNDPARTANDLRAMIIASDEEASMRVQAERNEKWLLAEVAQAGESAERASEVLMRPGVWHVSGKSGEALAYRKSVQYTNRLLDLLRADAVMVRVLTETGRLDAAEEWLDAAEKLWPAVFLAAWSLDQPLRAGEPSGVEHAQIALRKLIRQERRMSGLWSDVIDRTSRGDKGEAVQRANRLASKVSRNLVWPALLLALGRRSTGDPGILVPAMDAAANLRQRIEGPRADLGADAGEVREHTRSILERMAAIENENLKIFGYEVEGGSLKKEDPLDEALRAQGLGQEDLRRMLEPYEDQGAGAVPIHHERRKLRWIVVQLALAAEHLKPAKALPKSDGARLASMTDAKTAITRLQSAQQAISDALEKVAVSKKKELGHQVATSVVALLTDRFVNRPDDPLRRLLQAVKDGQVRAADMVQIGEELEVDYLLVSTFLDPDKADLLADWIGSFASSEAPVLPNEARMMLEVFGQDGHDGTFRPLFEDYAARAKELFAIASSLPIVADDPSQQSLDYIQRLINEALPAPRNVRLLYSPHKFRVNPNAALPGVDPERARGFGLGIDRLRWGQFFDNPLGEDRKSRLLYHVREPANIDWRALIEDIEKRIPEAAGSEGWSGLKQRLSGARMGAVPDIEGDWGWDDPTPDQTFKSQFGAHAPAVMRLAAGDDSAAAVVKSWVVTRVAAFDLFGHVDALAAGSQSARWVRYTDRIDLVMMLADGREVTSALYSKYLGDPYGVPIPPGSGPGPHSRISLASEFENARLAHEAGLAPASLFLDGQLWMAASRGRDITVEWDELRKTSAGPAEYERLAARTGAALGSLHTIRRQSPYGDEMEYLVHQDLLWLQGGEPVGIKEHIRYREDGWVEFIDLGSSVFRPDTVRLSEKEQLKMILLQLIPRPGRSLAEAAFDDAYEKAFASPRQVPGPFDRISTGARMGQWHFEAVLTRTAAEVIGYGGLLAMLVWTGYVVWRNVFGSVVKAIGKNGVDYQALRDTSPEKAAASILRLKENSGKTLIGIRAGSILTVPGTFNWKNRLIEREEIMEAVFAPSPEDDGARMATVWTEPFDVFPVFRKNLDIAYPSSARFQPGAEHLLIGRPVPRIDPNDGGPKVNRYALYRPGSPWGEELRARYEISGDVLAFEKDGSLIVSTGQSVEWRRSSDGGILEGRQYPVNGAVGAAVVNEHTLAILADEGRTLMVLHDRRGVIGTFETEVRRPSDAVPMAYSPATGMLAMGFYHTIKLLDLSGLTLEGGLPVLPRMRTLERHNQIGEPFSEYTLSIAFSADGRWLASGSEDQLIRLWNVAEGRVAVQLQEADGKVHAVAFGPDNKLFASWTSSETAFETVRAWKMEQIFPSAIRKTDSEGARMSAKDTDFIDGIWGGWLESLRRRSDKSGDRPIVEFAKAIDEMARLTDPSAEKGLVSPVHLVGSLMFEAPRPDPGQNDPDEPALVGMALSFNERTPRVYAGTISSADMDRIWRESADAGLHKMSIPYSKFKAPTFDRTYLEDYRAPGRGNSGIFWKNTAGPVDPAAARSVAIDIAIQLGALEDGRSAMVVEIVPDANLPGKERLRLYESAARHMDRVLSSSEEASKGRWDVVRVITRSSIERIFDMLPAREITAEGGAREAMRRYIEDGPVKSWIFGRAAGARMSKPDNYVEAVATWKAFESGDAAVVDTSGKTISPTTLSYYPFRKMDIRRMIALARIVSGKSSPTFVEFGAGSGLGSYLLAREGATAVAIESKGPYLRDIAEANGLDAIGVTTFGGTIYASSDQDLRLILIEGRAENAPKLIEDARQALDVLKNGSAEAVVIDDVDMAWEAYHAEGFNWQGPQESLNPKLITHIWNSRTGDRGLGSYGDTPDYRSMVYWQGPSDKSSEASYIHVQVPRTSKLFGFNIRPDIEAIGHSSSDEYPFIEKIYRSRSTDQFGVDHWTASRVGIGSPIPANEQWVNGSGRLKSDPGSMPESLKRFLQRQMSVEIGADELIADPGAQIDRIRDLLKGGGEVRIRRDGQGGQAPILYRVRELLDAGVLRGALLLEKIQPDGGRGTELSVLKWTDAIIEKKIKGHIAGIRAFLDVVKDDPRAQDILTLLVPAEERIGGGPGDRLMHMDYADGRPLGEVRDPREHLRIVAELAGDLDVRRVRDEELDLTLTDERCDLIAKNIMVRADGRLSLIDYDSALVLLEISYAEPWPLTPAERELVRFKDIFDIGRLLNGVLTATEDADLRAALELIIRRAYLPSSDSTRYTDMAELAADLRALMSGVPTPASGARMTDRSEARSRIGTALERAAAEGRTMSVRELCEEVNGKADAASLRQTRSDIYGSEDLWLHPAFRLAKMAEFRTAAEIDRDLREVRALIDQALAEGRYLTVPQIAAQRGVDKSILYNDLRKDPELRDHAGLLGRRNAHLLGDRGPAGDPKPVYSDFDGQRFLQQHSWYFASAVIADKREADRGILRYRPKDAPESQDYLEVRFLPARYRRTAAVVRFVSAGRTVSREAIPRARLNSLANAVSLPPVESLKPGRDFIDRVYSIPLSGDAREAAVLDFLKDVAALHPELSKDRNLKSPMQIGGINWGLNKQFRDRTVPVRLYAERLSSRRFLAIESELDPANRIVFEALGPGRVRVLGPHGEVLRRPEGTLVSLADFEAGRRFLNRAGSLIRPMTRSEGTVDGKTVRIRSTFGRAPNALNLNVTSFAEGGSSLLWVVPGGRSGLDTAEEGEGAERPAVLLVDEEALIKYRLDRQMPDFAGVQAQPDLYRSFPALEGWNAPEFFVSREADGRGYCFYLGEVADADDQPHHAYRRLTKDDILLSVISGPEFAYYEIGGFKIEDMPVRFEPGLLNLRALVSILLRAAPGLRLESDNWPGLRKTVEADGAQLIKSGRGVLPTRAEVRDGHLVLGGYKKSGWSSEADLAAAAERLRASIQTAYQDQGARMAEDASAKIITAAPKTLYRMESGFDPELLDRFVSEINGRIGSEPGADLTARIVGGVRYTGNMNRRDLDLSIEGAGGQLSEVLTDVLTAVDAAAKSLDPNARATLAEPDPFGLHGVPTIDVELADEQFFSIDLFEPSASPSILKGMRRALQVFDAAIEAWKNEGGSTFAESSSAKWARHAIQMAALKRVLLGVYVYGKPDEWRYLAQQFAALESSGLDAHDVAALGSLDPAWFEAVSFLGQKLNVTSSSTFSDPEADEPLIRDLNLSNTRPLEQVVSAARMADKTAVERPIYQPFGVVSSAEGQRLAAAALTARKNGMRGPAPVLLSSKNGARMAYTVVPEDALPTDDPKSGQPGILPSAVAGSDEKPLDIAARISEKYDQVLSLLEDAHLMPSGAVPIKKTAADVPVEVVVTLTAKDLNEADADRWREAAKEHLSAVRSRLSEKGIRLAVDLSLSDQGLAGLIGTGYAPDPKLQERRIYVRTPDAKGTRETLNFYMEPAGYADGVFRAAPLAETALLAAAVVRAQVGRSLWQDDALAGILPAWGALSGERPNGATAYTILIGIATPETNASYAAKAWRVGPRLAALIEVLRLGARMAAIAA